MRSLTIILSHFILPWFGQPLYNDDDRSFDFYCCEPIGAEEWRKMGSKASVTSDQISTFFNKCPLLTQVHQLTSSTASYWLSTTKYTASSSRNAQLIQLDLVSETSWLDFLLVLFGRVLASYDQQVLTIKMAGEWLNYFFHNIIYSTLSLVRGGRGDLFKAPHPPALTTREVIFGWADQFLKLWPLKILWRHECRWFLHLQAGTKKCSVGDLKTSNCDQTGQSCSASHWLFRSSLYICSNYQCFTLQNTQTKLIKSFTSYQI